MSARKIAPEILKILDHSKPTFRDGLWRKPAVSAMKLARLRNQYISAGYHWPQEPLRDRTKDRPPKGHKWERERGARQAMIQDNLKRMPTIIEEYKAERKLKRKKDSGKELTDPSKVLNAMRMKGGKRTEKELSKMLEMQKKLATNK
eukprot:m.307809 g.307809  ORF g.307809 m.307809 type:complete len:147 (+) comp42853_c0_seq1:38-478(+)